MAALLMDDIPQYKDFTKRFVNYPETPNEDPLKKLMYLSDNRYWEWSQSDRLDAVISKIISRTREIDKRLNQPKTESQSSKVPEWWTEWQAIDAGNKAQGQGRENQDGSKSKDDKPEPFLLPDVVDYVDTQEYIGQQIYSAFRESLNDEFCPSFYFIDGPPHPHLYPEQDKVSNVYLEHLRCIGRQDRSDDTVYYNNPFDPRIDFDGVEWLRTQPPKDDGQAKKTEENLFLAIQDISGMLEQHVLKYRLFLKSLGSRRQPNQEWSSGQGHETTPDLSRLESFPVEFDQNDKDLARIVEPLLRDDVKFLWMFDPQDTTVHLEQEGSNGPGPIGHPTRKGWPPRREPAGVEQANAEVRANSHNSGNPQTQDSDNSPTVPAERSQWPDSMMGNCHRQRWKDTFDWIPDVEMSAWKSASDPDLYRSSSHTIKVANSSSHEGATTGSQRAVEEGHPIPTRVTSVKRLPSSHTKKERPPPVRKDMPRAKDTQDTVAKTEPNDDSWRENTERFFKDPSKFQTNFPGRRQRRDSMDSGSTKSENSGSASPVKVHGHYTPADHFKYMVHQLAAEVRREEVEKAGGLGYKRGTINSRSRGRPYRGQGTRGRGGFKRGRAMGEAMYSGRRPFHWKKGVQNKFKWYSANYKDWNEQEPVLQHDEEDVEMVDDWSRDDNAHGFADIGQLDQEAGVSVVSEIEAGVCNETYPGEVHQVWPSVVEPCLALNHKTQTIPDAWATFSVSDKVRAETSLPDQPQSPLSTEDDDKDQLTKVSPPKSNAQGKNQAKTPAKDTGQPGAKMDNTSTNSSKDKTQVSFSTMSKDGGQQGKVRAAEEEACDKERKVNGIEKKGKESRQHGDAACGTNTVPEEKDTNSYHGAAGTNTDSGTIPEALDPPNYSIAESKAPAPTPPVHARYASPNNAFSGHPNAWRSPPPMLHGPVRHTMQGAARRVPWGPHLPTNHPPNNVHPPPRHQGHSQWFRSPTHPPRPPRHMNPWTGSRPPPGFNNNNSRFTMPPRQQAPPPLMGIHVRPRRWPPSPHK